ncbi:putative glycosyltransferase [Acanthamoeba polyphaga mimivirus]|uniref:Glycosyltransferase n=1 Tax=Acanthamoeba polyphaga mimivirus Kroon TaxID=3069720 RepID=A0A0G2Y967_9VIRU|nr:putative glycosyltransferase [Acanthamoeba polyphaga mimivirus]AKI80392.1 putative glycosyltransferase [Acanthamoeba polyphaga mimivirus Kroon]
MENLKIIVINLKRRADRREIMEKKFQDENITQYEFFEAFDGETLQPEDPNLGVFKHGVHGLSRKGVAGCALSHYTVWQKIATDTSGTKYLVLEDDINFKPNFKENLSKVMKTIEPSQAMILIGMTVNGEDVTKTRDIYELDTSYTIHPLGRDYYAGGLFGYILDYRAAKYFVDYISYNGIRIVIDYLTYRCGFPMYESHPHLVYTQSVQHDGEHVDSDIQHQYDRIKYAIIPNTYEFDDYVFIPNKDSAGGDIREVCADIPILKNIADKDVNCVAFNTYGWVKNNIKPLHQLIDIGNRYYESDGIYIKKNYILKEKIVINSLNL